MKIIQYLYHKWPWDRPITYISDYGGIIQGLAVHPSIVTTCCLIESVLPDGTNVPVHRDEHPTPAEGPILLPGQSQVQLLICGQVRISPEDPVCVTVPLRIWLDKKYTGKMKRQDNIWEAKSKKGDLLKWSKLSDIPEDLSKLSHVQGADFPLVDAAKRMTFKQCPLMFKPLGESVRRGDIAFKWMLHFMKTATFGML